MSEIFIAESNFRNRYQYSPADLLGEGGFAQVYKAYDKQFEEFVALKFYNKGDQGKYDVLHEMKDSRKFIHPNIIQVHDAFVVRFDHTGGHSDVQVGVLEFANGGNLRDFINTSPTEERFIDVLIGILNALEYLHNDKKIIHRDLSPENILMYVEGDKWIPKVADFGISKKIDYLSDAKDQKKSTQLLGKVDYMAPEQFYPEKFGINKKIDTNVDLWAFGVILYELFTHRKPFSRNVDDNPMKIIQAVTNDPAPGIDDIPDPYRTVIIKCLEKNANRRSRSAKELIAILKKTPSQPVSESAETIPIKVMQQKKNRKIIIYAGIIFSIITLLVVGLIILWPEKDIQETPPLPDPIVVQNEIKSLIEQRRYNQSIHQINLLPEEMRAQQEFIDLYNECINLKQADSLVGIGDQLNDEEKYEDALEAYMKAQSKYQVPDADLQTKIDKINIILDPPKSPEPPEPPPPRGKIYREGMFSVQRKPDASTVKLVSIQITKENTIISLLLYASDNTYNVYRPGTEGAFYLEYNNRTQRLPLLSIKGIKTGEINGLTKNTVMKLYFAKLPDYVKNFNLLEGKERLDEEMQYWNFIGIKLY